MRYAIYFAPHSDDPLWRFCSSALGYDAASGQTTAFPELPGLAAAEIAAWTAEPRRYGFHATLKAPFELGPGLDEAALRTAMAEFAARRRAFVLPALKIVALGRFLALVPDAPCAPLQALADACVIDFDPFRAPLSEFDRALRAAHRLEPRLQAQLERWGYPYVFDDFRFHMTLSGPLDDVARARFLPALRNAYAPVDRPVPIDGVTLFRQADRDAPFTIVERRGFAG